MALGNYTYTKLHTLSSYMGDWEPDLSITGGIGDEQYIKQLNDAIRNLRGKEDAFATKFGYSNCDELIKEIQNLFTGSWKTDLEVLERFKSDNLNRALKSKFENSSIMLKGHKVRLILKTDKTEEQLEKIQERLKKSLDVNLSNRDFRITSNVEGDSEINIGVDWDIPTIKKIVNLVNGKHFIHGQYFRGKNNKDISQSDYALMEYLRDNSIIRVIDNDNPGKVSNYEFRTSPLAYKPSELSSMNDESVKKFETAIRDFILIDLTRGASDDLRKAIEETWENKKVNVNFFMGGEGWVTHLIGALGEFITPAFFYYCARRLPKSKGIIEGTFNLVGQNLNKFKEQKSIDIEIAFFKSAGIQVKNYNGAFVKDSSHQDTTKKREVDVNLHPSDISSLTHDERIVPYIVNSYFNTSISAIPDDVLEQFFKYHAYEFLNLSIDDSQIEDRAVFYLIGGYLLPGSEILQAAFDTEYEKTISVSNTTMKLKGGVQVGDDEYYNPNKKNAPFVEYWVGNQYLGWTPTKDNDLLWEKNVLIHTSFTYAGLFTSDRKIF